LAAFFFAQVALNLFRRATLHLGHPGLPTCGAATVGQLADPTQFNDQIMPFHNLGFQLSPD
jgi:hypothetical protein